MFTNARPGHGMFTKILLFFIVLTFVLWGIGDIFRQGFGDGSVAKVGKLSVSRQDFARAVAQRKEDLRARLGKAFNAELARKLGVERMALDTIINRLLIEQEAASLGLVVGDEDVVDHIAHSPEFLDKNGHFSEEIYRAIINANRMTEQSFIESMKRDLANRMLMETIVGGIQASDELVRAVYRAQGEKRITSLLVLPAGSIKPEVPTEKELQDYYKAHTEQYKQPEYRKLTYIELKPEEMQAGAAVSEADLQKAYNERAEEFDQPERRDIEHLVFEKKEDAEKAHMQLVKGAKLEDLAKTMPVINKTSLHLGEMTKQSIPVAADEVFALKEGGISAPAQSDFGWHVVLVKKVLPAGRKPLAQVRELLTRDLRANAAEDSMNKTTKTLEDALGGGSTLEDAAAKNGLTAHATEAVTHEGTNAAGAKVALPAHVSFLDVAFSTQEKDHSRMTPGDKGGYFMVRVDAVQKETARPFAEVKQLVTDAVVKEKEETALRTMAVWVAAQVKSGKKAEEVLSSKNLREAFEPAGSLLASAETAEQGKLKGKTLPQELMKELFTLKPAASTSAYALPEGGYVIARVEQVLAVQDAYSLPGDSAALKPVRDELRQSLEEEMRRDYLNYLRGKYTVTIKTHPAQVATGEMSDE